MAIPCGVFECPADENDVNLTDFYACIEQLRIKNEGSSTNYKYHPYFEQAQDIAISVLLQAIFCDNNMVDGVVENAAYMRKITERLENAPIEEYSIVNNRLVMPNFDDLNCVDTPLGEACLGDENQKDPRKKEKHQLIAIGNAIKNNLRIAVANVNVFNVYNLDHILKLRKKNRQYARYKALADLVNEAIKERSDVLVLPENYVPLEWVTTLATKAAREGIAIVTGLEHLVVDKKVYNYTAVILPFKYLDTIPTAAVFFQLKKHYAPEERRIIDGYLYEPVVGNRKRPLYRWRDCYFPVYCCYDLASITDRAEFMSWADMVVAVECNKDIEYFSNIAESLARDLHCYFVQVNTSQYGDSRITQPARREERDILTVKGGLNQALIIGEIDIQALREFQLQAYTLQKDDKSFKPTPPGIDTSIVKRKIDERRKCENENTI
jgi:hypothetical protein